MKLFALLCSTLAIPGSAFAFAEASPPKRELWEYLFNSRVVVTDRERVIELAVLLPKLYGFNFVCQFQSVAAGAQPVAILPGEKFETAVGGTMHCPDDYDLILEKQTKLRIMQVGYVPRFVLEEGKITLKIKQDQFFFETRAFQISGVGEGKEQLLIAESNQKASSLTCDRGAVSMELNLPESPGPRLLSSRDCRLGVALNGSSVKRYLVGSDQVDAADIALPRRFWPSKAPSAQAGAAGAELLNGLQLSYLPSPNGSDPAKISWIVQRHEPSVLPELDCFVFGQKAEGEPPVEIQKFKSPNLSGSFTVDPAYRKGYVSMLCESEAITLMSNIQDLALVSQSIERAPKK